MSKNSYAQHFAFRLSNFMAVWIPKKFMDVNCYKVLLFLLGAWTIANWIDESLVPIWTMLAIHNLIHSTSFCLPNRAANMWRLESFQLIKSNMNREHGHSTTARRLCFVHLLSSKQESKTCSSSTHQEQYGNNEITNFNTKSCVFIDSFVIFCFHRKWNCLFSMKSQSNGIIAI